MSESLHDLFGTLTQGVYVVGVAQGERHNAFTASWVMQVSFDPPMLVLSINPTHWSYQLLTASQAFSVNVLKKGQLELAAHFGGPAKGEKLARVEWKPGRRGTPLLADALAWFECEVAGEYPAGDHVLVLGRVIAGAVQDGGACPLAYADTGNMDGSAVLYPLSF